MIAMMPAATAKALGEANICRLICLPMSSEPEARVTMIAAAVDNNSDGNCATKRHRWSAGRTPCPHRRRSCRAGRYPRPYRR
ncbi:hypothetical protein Ddc_21871 [Ditylenchus destructor]|nr:hypothetical protein Ddc_21871 [Ditylenchus destructor]